MKETSLFNIDWKARCKQLSKYKYIALLIGVGIVFLLFPTSTSNEINSKSSSSVEEEFAVSELEERLENILSQIDGAGQVKVMLTVKSGMKRVFAQDGRVEQDNELLQKESETVVISSGAGTQEAVLMQRIYPEFQGVLIVAEGGGDPFVKLSLTEAMTALTGLGADKISVCKGK